MLAKVAKVAFADVEFENDKPEFENKGSLKAVKALEENGSGQRKLNGVVKFEVFGQELIEKEVKKSGNSGRVYLPPNWVGHNVKIVRID